MGEAELERNAVRVCELAGEQVARSESLSEPQQQLLLMADLRRQIEALESQAALVDISLSRRLT